MRHIQDLRVLLVCDAMHANTGVPFHLVGANDVSAQTKSSVTGN